MRSEHLWHIARRHAPKSAERGKAKIREILSRNRDAFTESLHVVNQTEEDPCVVRTQAREGREERLIGAIEYRNMHPIDMTPGAGNDCIRKIDCPAKIDR